MECYLCIHGHFYQPPRENPWLEAIEIQDSAHPYHDWNEKVNNECYAPNTASRVQDGEGRIMDIINNYTKISFNFGPTVLSWLEAYSPEIYQVILDADRKSMELRTGHGNAIAQAYNHIILPLADNRDKRTQILWGIRDFEHRFKRFPEGMWLPETAVNLETLELLSELGIKFTVIAPHQASKIKKADTENWMDVRGGKIDPTRAYFCKLPSGRIINLFFYDGPISHAVAFEKILNRGEDFANRLLSGFSKHREWPQLLNIATDGETYGHHHKFGDMALAFAINYIESKGLAKLTNYGEYLEKYPPAHEVEIVENTSWSCVHGIERWRSDCGCNSGGHPEWQQEWRVPLRNAMDWLSSQLTTNFENKAKEYLKDPWNARDEYVDVIHDRSDRRINNFIEKHAAKIITNDEKITILKLLELQRHAMLMYTSCGWFFDEISGVEAVQVIQYAGRAIQLSKEIFNDDLGEQFLERLAVAKCNVPEYKDGTQLYEKSVKPGIIDLKKVGVHYAVSSLFEDYTESTEIYCYTVSRGNYQRIQSGRFMLAIGWIRLTSKVTLESECLSFCVIHLSDHVFNGGAGTFRGDEAYQLMKDEITLAFKRGDFADIIRLMDKYFGMHNYSLRELFRDEQRKILNSIIGTTLEGFETSYRMMYEDNHILMGFLHDTGFPVPKVFYTTAEFVLNNDFKKALENEIDVDRILHIVNDLNKWNIQLYAEELEFIIRHRIEKVMDELYRNVSDLSLLQRIKTKFQIIHLLPFEINLWHAQNTYYRMAKTVYKEFLTRAKSEDKDAIRWIDEFKVIGQCLFFNTDAVLSNE